MYSQKISGIYTITCIRTAEKYVGSSEHVLARWITHRSQLRRGIHHSKLLQQRWKEHGLGGFKFEIVEEVDVVDLLKRERQYVISGLYLCNATIPVRNPMKGRRHSPETIALMSANRKGKPGRAKGSHLTDAHKAKLSAKAFGRPSATKGRKRPPDEVQKIIERMRGKPSPMEGKRHTEDARQKMSAVQLQRDPSTFPCGSKHHQFGKVAWNRGVPAAKGGEAGAAKPIIVGGVVYPSSVDAANILGVCVSTLHKWRKRGKAALVTQRHA